MSPAVDPGLLSLKVRRFAGTWLMKARHAGEVASHLTGEVVERARADVDQATEQVAVAENRIVDRTSTIEELRARADDVQVAAQHVDDEAHHAREYVDEASAVVDELRRTWEAELRVAHEWLGRVRDLIKAADWHQARQAQAALPQALERVECCRSAVQDCREAAGLIGRADQRARIAAEAAEHHRRAGEAAAHSVEQAEASLRYARCLAEQAKYDMLQAGDRLTEVTRVSESVRQSANRVVESGRRAEVAMEEAADRLALLDRGGWS